MLLDNIKTMLDISLDCTTEDNKLTLIIEDGKQHLRSTNPNLTDEDFEQPTRARMLLFNYCRYAYCNATEAFDNNYKTELLALRHEYEVSEYENQNTD